MVELTKYIKIVGYVGISNKKVNERVMLEFKGHSNGRVLFNLKKEKEVERSEEKLSGKIHKMTEVNAIIGMGKGQMARIHRKYWTREYQLEERVEFRVMMREERNGVEWMEVIPSENSNQEWNEEW